MGESSTFKGEDTMIKGNTTPTGLLIQPIKFLLRKAPSKVMMGEEFEVAVRIVNTTPYLWPLRLDCPNLAEKDKVESSAEDIASSIPQRPSNSSLSTAAVVAPTSATPAAATASSSGSTSSSSTLGGLYFTHTTSRSLGQLEGSSCLDVTLHVFAGTAGLFDLPEIFAVHANTRERYGSKKLCKIFVVSSDDDPFTLNS